MEKILTCIAFAFLMTYTMSCEYNNEEELYPAETCDTANVTYHGTIAPLIIQNCFDCHGGTAEISGIKLEGYSNLKAIVDAGRLVGAIRHMQGFSAMPRDRPKLPECDILKIEKWVFQGAPDN